MTPTLSTDEARELVERDTALLNAIKAGGENPTSQRALEAMCDALLPAIEALSASNAALEAKLAEAREGLKPFAEADAELFNDWCPDETPAWYHSVDGFDAASPVTVGHFRRARTILGDNHA